MIAREQLERNAAVFAALGDTIRLKLLNDLADGQQRSISELSSGFNVSRQAVTKHLRHLEAMRLVSGQKSGRENLYQLRAGPLMEARQMIESIETQWDRTLQRLKAFIEDDA